MENILKQIPVRELHINVPFTRLLPMDERVILDIARSMKNDGFDIAHPIVVWKGQYNLIVDGHHRMLAALKTGVEKVWIIEREFSCKKTAVAYALHHNLVRGHYTQNELEKINNKAQSFLLDRKLKNFLVTCQTVADDRDPKTLIDLKQPLYTLEGDVIEIIKNTETR